MLLQKKKGLFMIIMIVLIMSPIFTSIPNQVFAAQTAIPFAGGTGTEADPYQIKTPEQLNEMRHHLSSHFLLIADIDLSDYLADGGEGFNDGKGWQPIGNLPNTFKGTFNGDGHVIRNLTINRPDEEYIGLFGRVYESSIIKNVGVEANSVKGKTFVGGLTGFNEGGHIANSYVSGFVSGDNNVGGLVGNNYNDWRITTGKITNSYALGKVEGSIFIGGLVGSNTADIVNSYAVGTVEGNNIIGGLVGSNDENVINSFWDTDVSQLMNSSGGIGKTSEEMQMLSTYTDAGWDFNDTWGMVNGTSYPMHHSDFNAVRLNDLSITPSNSFQTDFSFDQGKYDVVMSDYVQSINITATPADDNAMVTFNGDSSNIIEVHPGENEVEVEITGIEGKQKGIYFLNIIVPAPRIIDVSVPQEKSYGNGDSLLFTVSYDGPVEVEGIPQIPVYIGTDSNIHTGYAKFIEQPERERNKLIFEYIVEKNLLDLDGIDIGKEIELLEDGKITAFGKSAPLSFPIIDLSHTKDMKIDSIVPIGTLSINDQNSHTNKQNANLKIESSNNGGSIITKMRFSNDQSNWSAWEDYETTKIWRLKDGDGEKKVFMELNNEAGNVSNSIMAEITLDTMNPIITGVKNGGLYNEPVHIEFNEGTAKLNGEAFKNGTEINKDGTYELIVTDLAGNSTTLSFAIDLTEPTVIDAFITSNNSKNKKYAKVGDEISLDFITEEETLQPNVTIAGNEASVSGDGKHWNAIYKIIGDEAEGEISFTIKLTDLAGNINEIRSTTNDSTVILLKTVPTGTVTYSQHKLTNENVMVTLNVNDVTEITNNEGSNKYTFTENGSFVFELEDQAGNMNVQTIVVTNIVKKKPSIVLENVSSGHFKGMVHVDVSIGEHELNELIDLRILPGSKQVADFATIKGESILGETTFSIDQNGFYTVYARDIAGNAAVEVIEITNIKTTPFEFCKEKECIYLEGGKTEVIEMDAMKIVIPVGAIDEEMYISLGKSNDNISSNNMIFLSEIFEALKTGQKNFINPITIQMIFEPEKVPEGSTVAIYYYDENEKRWISIGGEIEGNQVTAKVDHFTKFAVMALKANTDDDDSSEETDDQDDPGKDKEEDPGNDGSVDDDSSEETDDQDDPGKDKEEDLGDDGSVDDGSSEETDDQNDSGKDLENNPGNNEMDDEPTNEESGNNQDKLGDVLEDKGGEKLPNTATTMYRWLLLGFIILILGGIMVGMNRFKKDQV